jgi:hypothetical protein
MIGSGGNIRSLIILPVPTHDQAIESGWKGLDRSVPVKKSDQLTLLRKDPHRDWPLHRGNRDREMLRRGLKNGSGTRYQ